MRDEKRGTKMFEMFLSGKSLKEISIIYNISYERTRQIIRVKKRRDRHTLYRIRDAFKDIHNYLHIIDLKRERII